MLNHSRKFSRLKTTRKYRRGKQLSRIFCLMRRDLKARCINLNHTDTNAKSMREYLTFAVLFAVYQTSVILWPLLWCNHSFFISFILFFFRFVHLSTPFLLSRLPAQLLSLLPLVSVNSALDLPNYRYLSVVRTTSRYKHRRPFNFECSLYWSNIDWNTCSAIFFAWFHWEF